MLPLTTFLAAVLRCTVGGNDGQQGTTVAAVNAMIRDPALFAAIVGLAMGLAMVVGHNGWTGGALPVVVTLVGWWTAIKSLALLTLPQQTMTKVFETARYEQRFYGITAVTLVIGVYLTYASFSA